MPVDLIRLPTYLAVPWSAFTSEEDPRVQLHMLVEAAEIAVRWSVVLALAELAYAGDGTISHAVANAINKNVERPTLYNWLAILEEVSRGKPPLPVAVPEAFLLHAAVVVPLVRPRDGTVQDSLYELRNLLAHGAGVSKPEARRLVEAHRPSVAKLLRAVGAVTRDVEVVAVEGGHALCLHGVVPSPREMEPRLVGREDGPWLVGREHILPLPPLATFAPVQVPTSDGGLVARSEEPFPQIYTRGSDDYLRYNPLGYDDCCFSEIREVAGFRRLFQLDAVRRPLTDRIQWDAFLKEARTMRGDLVGRTDELSEMKSWYRSMQALGGAWLGWVGGGPGFGKSMLMACLAVDVSNSGARVFLHRFRLGDARNNRIAFLRNLRDGLLDWPLLKSRTRSRPADESDDLGALELDVRERLGAIAGLDPGGSLGSTRPHLLVIVDGVDEVAAVDPTLPSLLKTLTVPETTWIVAGRPAHGLPGPLRGENFATLFADGLPRMQSKDVRSMLLKGLGKVSYDLVRRDQDDGESTHNAVVERITARAEGLPLYIHLFLEDVRRGNRSIDDRVLPQGLSAYFQSVIERMGLSTRARDLPLLVCLLACAEEPLDEATLACLVTTELTDASTLDARVREALVYGQMLLRAAPNPEGGQGWTLYHQSFRDEIGASPGLTAVRTEARSALGRLGDDWAKLPEGNARNHAFRQGNAYTLASNLKDAKARVSARLVDRPYLAERVAALGPATARVMVGDALLAESEAVPTTLLFFTHLAATVGPNHPVSRPLVAATVEACLEAASRGECNGPTERAKRLRAVVHDLLLTLTNHPEAAVQATAILGLMRMTPPGNARDTYVAVQQRLAADALWWFLPRPARLWPTVAWRLEPLIMLMLGVFLEHSRDDGLRDELGKIAGGLLNRLFLLRPLIWVGASVLEQIVGAMPEDYGTINLVEIKAFKNELRQDPPFAKLLDKLVGFIDPETGTMSELRAVVFEVLGHLKLHPSTVVNLPFEHPLLARAIAGDHAEAALELAHDVWKATKDGDSILGQDFVYFLRMVALGREFHKGPPLDKKWIDLAVEASVHFYFERKARFSGTRGRVYTPGCLIAVFPLLFLSDAEAGKRLMNRLVDHAWCGAAATPRTPAEAELPDKRPISEDDRCHFQGILLRVIEINSVEYGTWDTPAFDAALYGIERVLLRHDRVDDHCWGVIGTILARMRVYFEPKKVEDLLSRVGEPAAGRARREMAGARFDDGVGILIGLRAEILAVSVLGSNAPNDGRRAAWIELLRLLVRPNTMTETLRDLTWRFTGLIQAAVTDAEAAGPRGA